MPCRRYASQQILPYPILAQNPPALSTLPHSRRRTSSAHNEACAACAQPSFQSRKARWRRRAISLLKLLDLAPARRICCNTMTRDRLRRRSRAAADFCRTRCSRRHAKKCASKLWTSVPALNRSCLCIKVRLCRRIRRTAAAEHRVRRARMRRQDRLCLACKQASALQLCMHLLACSARLISRGTRKASMPWRSAARS